MIQAAPADVPERNLASPPAEPRPVSGEGQPDMDAFGELGPVLVGALVLWLAIVVAVASSVAS